MLVLVGLAFTAPSSSANYTDTKINRSEAELRGQLRHSKLVLRFFARHPLIAVQWRKRCDSLRNDTRVKNCRRARNSIHRHSWLVQQSRERLDGLTTESAVNGVWAALAECESDGTGSYNGSSGFDGGLQFHPGTWSAYRPAGYPAFAYQASPWQQIVVAERVLASQGWGAWPACSAKLGLR